MGNDERPRPPAQSDRAHSGREQLGPACNGRSGEHVIATSNASAEAIRMMWFKTLRLDIATKFLVLISEHIISSGN